MKTLTIVPNMGQIQKIGTPKQLATWCRGLRSGEYTQWHGAFFEESVPMSACCLMVAECEVDGATWPRMRSISQAPFSTRALCHCYPAHVSGDPAHVSGDPAHVSGDPAHVSGDQKVTFAKLNDKYKLSFEQIAQVIEGKTVQVELPKC